MNLTHDEDIHNVSVGDWDTTSFEEINAPIDVVESVEMMFSVEVYICHRITRTICYSYEFKDCDTRQWILQEKSFFLKKGFLIFDIRWNEFSEDSYLTCDLNVTFNKQSNSSLSIVIFKKKLAQVYDDLNVTSSTKVHLLKECDLKLFEIQKQAYVIKQILMPLYQYIIDYEECIREVNREHIDMELNYKISFKMMEIINYFKDDYKTMQVRFWLLDWSQNFTKTVSLIGDKDDVLVFDAIFHNKIIHFKIVFYFIIEKDIKQKFVFTCCNENKLTKKNLVSCCLDQINRYFYNGCLFYVKVETCVNDETFSEIIYKRFLSAKKSEFYINNFIQYFIWELQKYTYSIMHGLKLVNGYNLYSICFPIL